MWELFGIGGVTITMPIYTFIMAVSLLLGVGGSILFSICLGQKKERKAKRILAISTSLLIISGITITIVGLVFLDPILKFLGASGELLGHAKDYIKIILMGSVFHMLSLGLNSFVRAGGHPKMAMAAMISGSVTDAILDPIFIFVFRWGMFGAAISTVIGQAISTILILYHFLSKRCTYKIELKKMKLNFKYVRLIMANGVSVFLLEMSWGVLGIVINKLLVSHGGDIAISGMGIINSITMLTILPVIGLIQGATPIISYNHGAKNKKRILETVRLCVIISTIVMTACLAIAILLSEQMVSVFNHEEAILEFTSRGLIIWLLALPIIGAQIVLSSYFQSVGKYKIAMFLTLIRQIILSIPIIIIFAKLWGLDGILYAGPISDIAAFIATVIFFMYEYKKHYKNIKEETI